MWNEHSCVVVWTFFGITLLWDWNKNWPFPVLWSADFSRFAEILSATLLTASSFRFWNSSAGILSPPLFLFVVMPKVHWSLQYRMSDSRWMTTPSWLSGSVRPFLYSSSVYSCHFLISYAFIRSLPFLSFIVPIFAWNIPLISLIFLKRSLVFLILLFSSISAHHSFKKAFLSLCVIFETLHSDGDIFSFAFHLFLSYL